jgi:DHA1 family inner membrane transport protein
VSDRFGYLHSLSIGVALTVLGTWAYLYSDVAWVWIAANCLIGITWAFTIAYLLGLMSRFDTAGQMAALGGFASKMGLASGPAIAAMLLGENNYARIIIVAAVALAFSLLAILPPARIQDRGAN